MRGPNPERLVERAMEFDRDGDGKLNRDELMEFARSMPGPGGPGFGGPGGGPPGLGGPGGPGGPGGGPGGPGFGGPERPRRPDF
jgi:hypothetical protein